MYAGDAGPVVPLSVHGARVCMSMTKIHEIHRRRYPKNASRVQLNSIEPIIKCILIAYTAVAAAAADVAIAAIAAIGAYIQYICSSAVRRNEIRGAVRITNGINVLILNGQKWRAYN